MKAFFCIFCAVLMLPFSALAQLELSADTIAAESIIDFTVSGDAAPAYRYTVLREGEKLFTTETPNAFGSYLPRRMGKYTLRAEALYADGTKLWEMPFSVAQKLQCSLNVLHTSLRAGEPLKAQVQAQGGTGEYRYLYSISAQQKTLVRQLAQADWYWVPQEPGEYTLTVTVLDGQNASVQEKCDFTVEKGPGISLESSGGTLGGHGGQKSWTVYAPGSWTASTTADFITLETTRGECGEVLTVTAQGETDAYREGVITISSGTNRLEWSIAQSAAHGMDEEVYLFAGEDRLFVDGSTHAGWTNAQGSRSFAVLSPGEWTASSDSAFISVEAEGDTLTLNVEASDLPTVRSGVVTVACDTAAAYIHVYQPPAVKARMQAENVPLTDLAGQIEPFSQSSGLWNEKKYGSSTLEHSGCAIFALSHALAVMGYEGENVQPEALAKKYAFCLRDGGTVNATLVGNAGDDLGFKTRYDLYTNLSTIRSKLSEGAVFSFAVVNGHIAMVAGQSEDGRMLQIIDSAPSATWERIKNARLYRQAEDGTFVPLEALTDLGNMRYYIENDAFGGAVYWLEAEYVARRGVRLIQKEK